MNTAYKDKTNSNMEACGWNCHAHYLLVNTRVSACDVNCRKQTFSKCGCVVKDILVVVLACISVVLRLDSGNAAKGTSHR